MLNYLAACLIAGFPSNRIPLGSFPSGDMFLILRINSESSLRVENILFIFATDYILLLMFRSFFFLASSGAFDSSITYFMSTLSSSTSLHFFTIVNSILPTFSARNGRDHENTFKPSGSLYGGSLSWYYLSCKFPSSKMRILPLLS